MWGESISDHGREVFLERTRNCLAALGSFTLATAQDVLRGGSWIDWPNYARSAKRRGIMPSYRLFDTGFRVAMTQ